MNTARLPTMILMPMLTLGIISGCNEGGEPAGQTAGAGDADARQREWMVREQIEGRGVRDPAVLAALRKVPRHEFVPREARPAAHNDHPLPIGASQTISQPYIVALMTELARLKPGDRVLEIGTGSGYQAAVLAEVAGADRVFSMEIIGELAARAQATLARLGYGAVKVRHGDGHQGWPEEAPFDAIVVTAAPGKVPPVLLSQLKPGGRLVIPVGVFDQELMVYTRTEKGFREESVIPVRFVPMTGRAQEER